MDCYKYPNNYYKKLKMTQYNTSLSPINKSNDFLFPQNNPDISNIDLSFEDLKEDSSSVKDSITKEDFLFTFEYVGVSDSTSRKSKSTEEEVSVKNNEDVCLSNIPENFNLVDYPQNMFENLVVNKITENFYKSFEGKFLILLKNYNGSLLMQNCLELTDKAIISKIFSEINNNISELLIDAYGNYFCQKLYQFLNQSERFCFLSQIKDTFFNISSNSYGNYALQTVIENLRSDEEIMFFVSILKKYLPKLLNDSNSIFVLEKLILCINEDHLEFLYKYIIENFVPLALNPKGICAVKKLIISTQNPLTLLRLQNITMRNFKFLITHQIGNHVIQTMLEVNFYFNFFSIGI